MRGRKKGKNRKRKEDVFTFSLMLLLSHILLGAIHTPPTHAHTDLAGSSSLGSFMFNVSFKVSSPQTYVLLEVSSLHNLLLFKTSVSNLCSVTVLMLLSIFNKTPKDYTSFLKPPPSSFYIRIPSCKQ
jgi:hypothetical protein